ncbi:RNA polymerase sigma-70 factor [Autumnicola musiva]|uniref:RNA polymerase sigma-70 factor n=1 Tax=Autumnicola musiva TaxID=3075589 RepID=A0ABU3D8U5_9FLAO|nr:RNA polymerase sigma-70 factor [Zunongwangia sp. F117]MDT0677962.1 RNA polymerase sigma-70 factor [Zunongwangia sp. F117]
MNDSALTLKEFRELFQSLYPSLCLFANSYLKNTGISKDVTQEVFINVWEKKVKFTSYAAAKSFLYTAVKNKCIDHLRSSRVRLTEHSVEVDLLEQEDMKSFFYKEALSAETAGIIKKTIDELPPKCREIMRLSLKELTNPEIAEELSISINTVKTQKKIAYSKLRSILQQRP